MIKFILLCLLVCAYANAGTGGVKDITNGLKENGLHVCKFTNTVSRQKKVSFTQHGTTKKSYKTCNFFKCKILYRYEKKTYAEYRMITEQVPQISYGCCSKWRRTDEKSDECKQAICSVDCKNGGKCVKPDICECSGGFEGNYCQIDVDECADTNKNQCQQQCINLKPGHACGCWAGYALAGDGNSCKDINECNGKTPCGCLDNYDGNCKATCNNTKGSYKCLCGDGYELDTQYQCKDIDECIYDPTICDQKCTNKPGSYECECFNGYTYDKVKKKCVDIDECSSKTTNPCTQKCNNVQGGFMCTCNTGFYLHADRHTCVEIANETKVEHVCESDIYGLISCDSTFESLKILSAYYGRTSEDICQINKYKGMLTCQEDATTKLKKECDGQNDCVFDIPGLFGDPCRGYEKYVTVTYQCPRT